MGREVQRERERERQRERGGTERERKRERCDIDRGSGFQGNAGIENIEGAGFSTTDLQGYT